MSQMVLHTLEEILICCQSVHVLLKKDGEYFGRDKFAAMQESNRMKMDALSKLSALIEKIHTICPGGLTEYIKENRLEEAAELVQKINSEVANCNKYIEINSSMVFANLQMLKDVWDKLIICKADDTVYDVSGNLIKR